MKKVMIFGTFNIIHPGHLSLFRQAKRLGENLYVVVARNETVIKLKNYNPLDESTRISKLSKVPLINKVILGDLNDYMNPIRKFKPDIICLGYDQLHFIKELETFLEKENMNTIIVRLEPYKQDIYKSSKLR